ncbi:MAG TPA: hypothetical protein VFG30_37950 [Polyangiales bacterium]|nr:hypothetical protein [Polyangiales bacterium]
MGFLDRLLGRTENPKETRAPESADDQAIARYRYLLRTAPPDAVEQAHAEAFSQLTPAQRQQLLEELGRDLPASERGESSDPRALARMATRAELRQPGFLERTLGPRTGMGGMGGGLGMGGMFAGSLLSSIAGTFIGTAIAHQFLGGFDEHEQNAGDDNAHSSQDTQDTSDAHSASDAQDTNNDYAAADETDVGGGDDFGGDGFDGGDFDV